MADSELDTSDLVTSETKTNSKSIICPQCPSRMLCTNKGVYEVIEFDLIPMSIKKGSTEAPEAEKLSKYFRVDKMFDFDNIGFSTTVGDTKYLCCADCEIGPVGWHSISTKKSYLSLNRIKYK